MRSGTDILPGCLDSNTIDVYISDLNGRLPAAFVQIVLFHALGSLFHAAVILLPFLPRAEKEKLKIVSMLQPSRCQKPGESFAFANI